MNIGTYRTCRMYGIQCPGAVCGWWHTTEQPCKESIKNVWSEKLSVELVLIISPPVVSGVTCSFRCNSAALWTFGEHLQCKFSIGVILYFFSAFSYIGILENCCMPVFLNICGIFVFCLIVKFRDNLLVSSE